MSQLTDLFSSIADSIRNKGIEGTMKPIEMASKIGQIAGGSTEMEDGLLQGTLTRYKSSIITTIRQYAFARCSSLQLIDFTGYTGTTIPVLSNVNAFGNINDTYKIVVPDALYSTWIAATNWSNSSIKPHIMKQSDWNSTHPDDQL